MSRVEPMPRLRRQRHLSARRAAGSAHRGYRPASPRIPRRRSRPSPLRLLRRAFGSWFLGKLMAAGLLVGVGWALSEGATAPALRLSRVALYGNQLVPSDEILAALSVEGMNVFTVRSARIERSLEANPAIETAQVRPRLPDAIQVTIAERTPVAIWDTGARAILIDAGGLALREGRPNSPGPLLPVVYAPDGPVVEPGERVDPDAVRMAQSIAPRLESLGLARARIEYRPTRGVTLVGPGSPRVALGFGDNLEPKLSAYVAIRRHIDQTRAQAELIDVRFLERPYFR